MHQLKACNINHHSKIGCMRTLKAITTHSLCVEAPMLICKWPGMTALSHLAHDHDLLESSDYKLQCTSWHTTSRLLVNIAEMVCIIDFAAAMLLNVDASPTTCSQSLVMVVPFPIQQTSQRLSYCLPVMTGRSKGKASHELSCLLHGALTFAP